MREHGLIALGSLNGHVERLTEQFVRFRAPTWIATVALLECHLFSTAKMLQ